VICCAAMEVMQMQVLDDVPRLSIPRDAAAAGYSRTSSVPHRPMVFELGTGAEAGITVAPALALDGSCAVCGRVECGGLLRRVDVRDRLFLRPERIVFTCACETAFVRVDGRV
jgi:hypothetical protein